MTLTTTSQLAQDLEETNSRLRTLLDRLLPSPAPAGVRPVVTSEQMAELLSVLMRAGAWLKESPRDGDPALVRARARYRVLVERLRSLLPLIHQALLSERARLEGERLRVATAEQWVRRSRETF